MPKLQIKRNEPELPTFKFSQVNKGEIFIDANFPTRFIFMKTSNTKAVMLANQDDPKDFNNTVGNFYSFEEDARVILLNATLSW